MTVVHSRLVTQAPGIVEFFRGRHLEVKGPKRGTSEEFEETAVWFLRTQHAVWTQWVQGDMADRVRVALKDR